MRTIILTMLCVSLAAALFAQELPDDYMLEKTIIERTLEFGVPKGVMVDESQKYFVIFYDSKPMRLKVFDMNTWNEVNDIAIPKDVFIDKSFMDCNAPILYADFQVKSRRYLEIDLESGIFIKTKKKDIQSPNCGYAMAYNARNRKKVLLVGDKWAFRINQAKRFVEVFIKKEKRT